MSAMSDVRAPASSPFTPVRKWKNAKWKSIKAALIPGGRTSVDHASFYMLSLYRANLEVKLRTIDESKLSPAQHETYEAVVEMLKTPLSGSMNARNLEWDEIYKAESLLALLLNGAQLRQEINAQLQNLARESPAEADNLGRDYETLLKPPGDSPGESKGCEPDDAIMRDHLLRIMESLHWSAKKKYLARPIRIEATNRIVLGMLVSFLLLVTPYILLNFDYATEDVSKWWSVFALWTALTAGLLGAFFSRLISIQGQWANLTLDEVFLHREWTYTILRAGVGVCGALIVYFFLRSGIAEGALFPAFTDIKIELVRISGNGAVPMTFVMPSKSLALLTFWCFLAGFSEKLVPNILGSTERQLSEAATQSQVPRK